MAEKITHKHETQEQETRHEIEKKELPDLEKLHQEAVEKADDHPQAETLKSTVESHALSKDEIKLDSEHRAEKQQFGVYASLKSETYSRTLGRVQQRLSKPERAMSKVMHHKTVEKVSDGLGKTAARPSGILGGGIVSLLGSFVLLYMTKTYGFEYNFIMFFIFLAAGFALGVLIELVIFAITKVRK